jgi:hypothetical protein
MRWGGRGRNSGWKGRNFSCARPTHSCHHEEALRPTRDLPFAAPEESTAATEQQIPRSATPTKAKAALVGGPGCARDDSNRETCWLLRASLERVSIGHPLESGIHWPSLERVSSATATAGIYGQLVKQISTIALQRLEHLHRGQRVSGGQWNFRLLSLNKSVGAIERNSRKGRTQLQACETFGSCRFF